MIQLHLICGNYLVSKYIENLKILYYFVDVGVDIWIISVLLSNEEEFKKENEKMLSMIHYFDVLRSDRNISNCSLEARVPFVIKI